MANYGISDKSFIELVNDIVAQNLTNEKFGVEELTQELGVSRTQLHRKLKLHSQKSATQLIREIRLKKAKELLEDNNFTAAEVAYKVGFNSPNYFNTCFHDFYGYTPGEAKFRKVQRSKKKRFIPYKVIITTLAFGFLLLVIYSMSDFLVRIPSLRNKKIVKSIAVLPFRDDSEGNDNQYFCDGIRDEIISNLQMIPELYVKSSSYVEGIYEDSVNFSEIRKKLKASLILEGSVRKNNDRFRISARLIDVNSRNIVWTDNFNGHYSDTLFVVQSTIAKKIALSLNAVITPAQVQRISEFPTKDIEAYDYFIKSEYELSQYWSTLFDDHIKKARDFINKAIEIDPYFSKAYVTKANTYFAQNNYDSMMIYLDRAIDLDPNIPVAYQRKGRYYHLIGKPDLAIYHLHKSLQLNENSLRGIYNLGELYCLQKNDPVKGLPYLKRAVELGRDNGNLLYDVGMTFFELGEYNKAKLFLEEALQKDAGCRKLRGYNTLLLATADYTNLIADSSKNCDPLNCGVMCSEWLLRAYKHLGEFKEAEKIIDKLESEFGAPIYNTTAAYFYFKGGRTDDANYIFESFIKDGESELKKGIRREITWFQLAQVNAFRNNKIKAIESLNEITNKRFGLYFIDLVMADPMFQSFWDDDDFQAIVDKETIIKNENRRKINEMENRGELDWISEYLNE